jgi:hypothetical protein
MMTLLKFIKNQWFGVLIIIVLLFLQYKSNQEIELYKLKLEEIDKHIEVYKIKDEQLQIKIDSLSSLDAKVVEKIRTIKEKEYVQLKVVDSMPVSELQEFFTDRYSGSNSN